MKQIHLRKNLIFKQILMQSELPFILLSWSYIFDEDTGESQLLEDMTFLLYLRPQMILVDQDFCQEK